MRNQFELLAPGGDIESIKAAIAAGADAIYCGLDHFNARNRATNLTFDNLNGVVRLAHEHDCKIFLTLNIIILESEIPTIIRLLNKLVNTKIDGVIVQDLGLFYILKEHFKDLDVHASTQVNTHNDGQIFFLNKLTASRVNLSRELNIKEIKHLAQVGREHNVLMEVFVHGSYCIGFSGLCYISSVRNGNSGNRGRCSQPCRDQYQTTQAGKDYPLNLKDNSAYSDLKELADAGVYSLKVEGRIKKSHYVYTVVDNWRKQIENYCNGSELLSDTTELYTVFNRDFSNSFLKGDINKNMFIDNPRDHSAKHFSKVYNCKTDEDLKAVKKKLYDDKTDIISTVSDKIKDFNIDKQPLTITVSGNENSPLRVSVTTPDMSFDVYSDSNLIHSEKNTITHDGIEKLLNSLNNAEYYIDSLAIEHIDNGLFVPFKELTAIKKQIVFTLNGSKARISPVEMPVLKKQGQFQTEPTLSVLISTKQDIELCDTTSADIYYQLPESVHSELTPLVNIFSENEKLIPWFPSILIGENYTAAVEFLDQVKPKLIVTNNTGIAYAAYEKGIDWIAGPYLNIMNSFSLLCMKEEFNCVGSFISNEINQKQIKPIVRPENFKLFYSIYHPILLMTSRQCLFHQTVGCKKKAFDTKCLKKCKKSASIINLKEASFVLDKQKGDHNSLYSEYNFLNTAIPTDLDGVFSDFFIDLRDINTETCIKEDKASVVQLFQNLIVGKPDAKVALEQAIYPTTNAQYKKGL
ncbi:peptidase U32 family protein [Photobacterium chitinilyticum]|uniref:U32 family peptidase n=1 Tax=Photobacterium chitinilyticum TaxID=2485123 RepID=A0A444JWJ0_9GAMM|nr:peptidase U32 family protein [Photobacterium chitinilyticum]RWX57435.1 U32 family peptidase [Photobacterium chitinilyticum]